MLKAILGTIIFYLPSLTVFFSSDDWFHLRITQINSVYEFFNFFSFIPNSQSASFYRPLPTQVFFFIFQKFFGLNPLPYHLFVLLCFGFSIYLVYKFSQNILKNEKHALISTLIYTVSATNFTRIYFLSAFQEISLVIFSLLCLLSFKNSWFKSLIFFVLALMSKETAVIIPLLIFIFNYQDSKGTVRKLLPFLFLLVPYLYLRLKVFGVAAGDSYLWSFSPNKVLNTLTWYVLWSFGAPELLVDYIGSGFVPISRFFTDLPYWWPFIIFPLLLILIAASVMLIKKISYWKKSLPFILLFILPLLPVIFLPQHKFPLELGLSMVGFSLLLTTLLPESKPLKNIFLTLFIIYNLSMMILTYPRHYSVTRAQISQKIYLYFNKNYSNYPSGKYFEFVNDTKNDNITWGESRQISQALSGSDFFKVYYHNPEISVYYEDIEAVRPSNLSPSDIQSSQFLNP